VREAVLRSAEELRVSSTACLAACVRRLDVGCWPDASFRDAHALALGGFILSNVAVSGEKVLEESSSARDERGRMQSGLTSDAAEQVVSDNITPTPTRVVSDATTLGRVALELLSLVAVASEAAELPRWLASAFALAETASLRASANENTPRGGSWGFTWRWPDDAYQIPASIPADAPRIDPQLEIPREDADALTTARFYDEVRKRWG